MKCIACQLETTNPKYCSRACAARTNNTVAPKRKPEGICRNCNISISKGRTYCKPCWSLISFSSKRTVGEYMQPVNNSTKYAAIRSKARYITRDFPRICVSCGYSKHVQVCHIKPVSSFGLEDNIELVNALNNLILLCPNCHWELDNGLLNV